MDICVDFDGTCVAHDFPSIGADIGSVPVLQKLVEKGHRLILFTMRSNMEENGEIFDGYKSGDYLTPAVDWFKENGIPLYGINENPTQKRWTKSPKAHGHLFIDDLGLGIPLKYDSKVSPRPFVDWLRVESMLIEQGIL